VRRGTEVVSGRLATMFVTPVAPNIRGGGPAQRAFHWLTELARTSDVHLIVVSPTILNEPGDEVLTLVASYRQFVAPRSRCLVAGKVAVSLFPFLAIWRRSWIQHWMDSATIDSELSRDPSIGELPIARIVVFRLYMHDIGQSVAKALRRVPVMDLDLDDIESSNRFGMARLAGRRLRLGMALKCLLSGIHYRFLENRLLRPYERIYVAAAEDSGRIAHLVDPNRLVVRPNCLSGAIAPLDHIRRLSSNFTLLFVGTLGYFPNEDAALWLKEKLGPILVKTMPAQFRIVVAGRGASGSLRKSLRKAPFIDFRGELADLAAVYQEADVCVAPLRAGSGTKFKLLEAFLYGRPIVATREAARGTGACDEVHYLNAEDPTAFAAACCRLVCDDSLRKALVRQGRQLLSDHFLLPASDTAVHPRGGSRREMVSNLE
jgi:glycosyltransferase involved in cell wall biosynthesis